MKENLRRNIRLRLRDRKVAASELTRARLDLNCSSLHYATNDPSNLWTEEKHRLYLDSLEMTFVNQLHNSIALSGCLKDKREQYSPQNGPSDCRISLHQFLEQQQSLGQNINSEDRDPVLESTADSQFSEETVHLFASSGRRHNVAPRDFPEDSASNSRETCEKDRPVTCGSTGNLEHQSVCHVCHQESSSIEASDQNFVDANIRRADGVLCRTNIISAQNSFVSNSSVRRFLV